MRYGLPEDRWTKSSYSTAGGNDCLETQTIDGHLAVRDSKTPERGAHIFTPETWGSFLKFVKSQGIY
ncbi:DUF397 domain-containing protein [Streptomyces sp. PT12]|uniref:DUF397 domain-containing protein n=1 Tax=Streptomyces sp. PT12 TaxID=1510197 RepID=UPI000DE57128|nr:DUF397 domain-containing protein [Streptomyces sp. PT12]RBM14157.1 DUF397 domain-containing protein [Streptomyces sp. PT12]